MELSIRDAAKFLNVSETLVHRWITTHELPTEAINGQFRFNRTELLEWATNRKLEISPLFFQEKNGDRSPDTFLEDAIRRGGIHFQVPGTDTESALQEITRRMPLPTGCDADFIYQVFLSREQAGSTCLGDGLAFPHPRYPVVLPISHPFISLCFLQQSIRYSAKGDLVHTLFALISPTVREHLKLLARLAFALRDRGFHDAIQNKKDPEEILREAQRVEKILQGTAGEENR